MTKTLRIHLPLLVTCMLFGDIAYSGSISTDDRTKAINYLNETNDLLLQTVKNLTMEQLNYKTSEDSWSIAQCVEHIAISEEIIFSMARGTLKEKSDKEVKAQFSDDQLIQMIADRSKKVKTQEVFEPSNKFNSYKGSLKAFKTSRKTSINYLKNTQDDLRNHFFQFPFGTADAYQVILFMSSHTKRHVLQIEEIINSTGFPK
ncbi:DinB family protein [Reichenbachiella sp. MALMAid0571]|uniref:DinB family protein n=1 Tax=Reichenbachiella sp. MALMAid0571 TaxID=3143939 RepID=UPI0032DF069B